MKRFIIAAAASLGLLMAAGAHAQEANVSAAASTTGAQIKAEVRLPDPRPTIDPTRLPIASTTKTTATGTPERPADIKARIEARAGEGRSQIGEGRPEGIASSTATTSTVRAEARAQAILAFTANFSDRVQKTSGQLEKAVARLEGILAKIEARMAKAAEAGAEVSTTTSAVAESKLKIEAARASVSAVSAVTVSQDEPRAAIESLKQAVVAAQEAIKEAHRALVTAIESIKRGQVTE